VRGTPRPGVFLTGRSDEHAVAAEDIAVAGDLDLARVDGRDGRRSFELVPLESTARHFETTVPGDVSDYRPPPEPRKLQSFWS
jgi:hypothetical protein